MSGPVPVGCAANGDHTEGKKNRAKDSAIFEPGEASKEERHGGERNEAARFGVHFCCRFRKGQRSGCPLPLVRESMALNRRFVSPRAARQAIFLGATGPRAARPEGSHRGVRSRPRPVGGVNQRCDVCHIDVSRPSDENIIMSLPKLTGNLFRAGRALAELTRDDLAIAVASVWRRRPSQPRALVRSRASASGRGACP
jgi:hypothetical protein